MGARFYFNELLIAHLSDWSTKITKRGGVKKPLLFHSNDGDFVTFYESINDSTGCLIEQPENQI